MVAVIGPPLRVTCLWYECEGSKLKIHLDTVKINELISQEHWLMKLGGVDKSDHSSSEHMTLDCRLVSLTTDGTKV